MNVLVKEPQTSLEKYFHGVLHFSIDALKLNFSDVDDTTALTTLIISTHAALGSCQPRFLYLFKSR